VNLPELNGLPPLDQVRAAAHVVVLPMRVPFRGVTSREALLLQGPDGWAEFSPFLEYPDAEAARWLAAALEAGWGRAAWPSPVRPLVPVNATVPAVEASQVPEVLARFDGCRTAKVRVCERGQSLADDVARVRAVREVLGDAGRVRVDANGGWSVDQALVALRSLAPFGLEYAEQPCATVNELGTLRKELARVGLRVLVAADESIRKAEDPMRVAVAGAADLVVLKVAPLGGVGPALAVARRLREEFGLGAVVSSALDTSVGMSAAVAFAGALPQLDHACGLGTVSLFESDVAVPPLVPKGGFLATGDAIGGVAADAGMLVALAGSAERRQWWLERLERCWLVLARG